METNTQNVTVETIVNAPIEKVWASFTEPEHIMKWNAASDDWETSDSVNDLRVGGMFSSHMQAKDKSVGFDFGGTYTEVIPNKKIAYVLDDDRKVDVTFEVIGDSVKVTETFDIEHENSAEMQRSGWQAILDNFKKHTEENVTS